MMTETHSMGRTTFTKKDLILLKEREAVSSALQKLATLSLTSDTAGLERKFEAKERNRNKPGVVSCGSME